MERLTVSPELGEATQDFERARGEFFEQKFGISPTSLAAMEKAGLRTGIKVNFGAKAITLPDELERYAKEFFGENDYHVDSLDFAKEALYLRMSSYTGNVLQKSLRFNIFSAPYYSMSELSQRYDPLANPSHYVPQDNTHPVNPSQLHAAAQLIRNAITVGTVSF